MTQTAQTLVGRDGEVEVLERLLDAARAGEPRFVAVSGEPGIGKSSVLAELARRARDAGCLVLEGRATELERELPFGPVVDALDAHLDALDARSFDRLAVDVLAELTAVFPSLRTLTPDAAPLTTAAERFRAHRAVRDVVERLAGAQPVVLLLDDLHWSDGASLELVAHLLRRPPEAAVLVALSYRAGQAPKELHRALAGAAAPVEELALGPLAVEDAERLLAEEPRGGGGAEARVAGGDGATGDGRRPGAGRAAELHRASGGNPFYLLQLARRGAQDPSAPPPAVAAAIAEELDGLAPRVRAFAQAAAVAGDPFDLEVAVATAATPEAEALDALDELLARDMVRATEVPRRFRFRHPLVRTAIYASCTAGRRIVMHERAGAALAARGAPAPARAHHVEQAARHGDTAAVDVLREAGLAVASRAPASAARWFDAAVRILPASAPAHERIGLLAGLASTRSATGRFEDARDALDEAAGLMDAGAARAPLVSACAVIELLLGRREESRGRLLAELDALPHDDAAAAARLTMDLSLTEFYATDYEASRQWAARALETARTTADRPLLAGALSMLALAESSTGPASDATAHCDEAAALVDAMPDGELVATMDGVAHLCGAEYCVDRFEAAERHARRGLELARTSGRGELFPGMSQSLAGALFSTGRLADAQLVLDEVVEAARLTDNAITLSWGLLNRAYVAVARGQVDLALREAEEAVALTRGMERGVMAAWAGGVHGAALVEAGEPERAAATLVRSGGGEALPLIPGGFRANFLEILTQAWLGCDRREEAGRAAEAAQERAARFGLRLAGAVAERAAAAVAFQYGDAAEAAERALASAEGCDAVGARMESAISRTLAGRALLKAGRTGDAVTELERAAADLEACGARRHRDRAERELRRLGRGVHRRTRRGNLDDRGVASLTGRELEIARLVVDRRTNPEIAAELFLSIKTVETHLRNIFRKLGADSRVEVARIVERAEAAGAP
ncbi:MAG TPA: AAA family ATPase [Solirubrobacteraceae bacterium]|jgi:DNA-binding CsgD family transcriptional regulator